jgi:PEP-CTERM motif
MARNLTCALIGTAALAITSTAAAAVMTLNSSELGSTHGMFDATARAMLATATSLGVEATADADGATVAGGKPGYAIAGLLVSRAADDGRNPPDPSAFLLNFCSQRCIDLNSTVGKWLGAYVASAEQFMDSLSSRGWNVFDEVFAFDGPGLPPSECQGGTTDHDADSCVAAGRGRRTRAAFATADDGGLSAAGDGGDAPGSVPEPGTLGLMALGLAGIALAARRKGKRG